MRTFMLLLFTIAILISSTVSLNVTQPLLVNKTMVDPQMLVMNITVGQKFALPLNNFDEAWSNKNFQAYLISGEEFNRVVKNKKKNILQTSQPIDQKSSVGLDFVQFTCQRSDPKLTVNVLKQLHSDYSRVHNYMNWQQNQYIHFSSKNLIYVLSIPSSQIRAYYYTAHTMKHLTSYTIPALMNHYNEGQSSVATPVMAASSNQEKLFIFSNTGMFEIQTKTILTQVKLVLPSDLGGFSSKQKLGIDKMLHGQNDLLIVLKRKQAVFIVPEPKKTSQINQYTTITQFNGTKLTPYDIQSQYNYLFILDFYKGVYVFEITGSSRPQQKYFIPHSRFGGNFQFAVFKSNMFIHFNDVEGSKIVEINFDIKEKMHFLVRYFKIEDSINSINIFSSSTHTPSGLIHKLAKDQSPSHNHLIDSFLFLVESLTDLEIYPYNKDPRIIEESYNGVKIKGEDIKKIFHIEKDRYILITNQYIKYVQLRIQKPSIICSTHRSAVAPSEYYHLTLKTKADIICQQLDKDSSPKKFSNQNCQLTQNYYIHIIDPQYSSFQKMMLYGVVLMVVLFFIIGLLCLTQWRNNKLIILKRLKEEIIRFRNRHKKMQPFNEQEDRNDDVVEIEVPKVEE